MSGARALYDEIGIGYVEHRRPDPRIAAAIDAALGGAGSVLNVGAGTGSYEPLDRPVVAVEPSIAMIRQRAPRSAQAIRASAPELPFPNGAFDAALSVLTVHHWPDRVRGLREMLRVARNRVVIVTWDPATYGFWLIDDYFPEIREIDRRGLPSLDELLDEMVEPRVLPLPVPHDCTDGFLGAYWRRPRAYLDPGVRGAISAFAKLEGVEARLARLRRDLDDGSWEQRNGHLSSRSELDIGYRLLVSRGSG